MTHLIPNASVLWRASSQKTGLILRLCSGKAFSLKRFSILDRTVRRYSTSLGAFVSHCWAPVSNVLYSRHEAQRPLPLPFADYSQPDIYEFVPTAARPQFHAGKRISPTLGTLSRSIQRYEEHPHLIRCLTPILQALLFNTDPSTSVCIDGNDKL